MTPFWLPGAIALGALAACAPVRTVTPPPAAIADLTLADERGALSVEIAYRMAGALLEAAIDTGRLRGVAARRADVIDAEAARLVGLARAAYDVGDTESYMIAVARAAPLIVQVRALAESAR